MKEKPEEYQKFFDSEYKNFYEELKADQPPQIDVQAQVYERFRDFEVQLESDKRTNAYVLYIFVHHLVE